MGTLISYRSSTGSVQRVDSLQLEWGLVWLPRLVAPPPALVWFRGGPVVAEVGVWLGGSVGIGDRSANGTADFFRVRCKQHLNRSTVINSEGAVRSIVKLL